MKAFISELRSSVAATLALAFVCCGLYPLLVFGIGQVCFPQKANGSLITDSQHNVLGSCLIGQPFSADTYFHPRPSAAGNGYDAANSGGSNLGPTSQKLYDTIKERVDAYRKENRLKENQPVPADAVTASGSGLDPHISLSNAGLQCSRVAAARGLPEAEVRGLIRQHTEPPGLGILGDPGVKVLTLNLALDSLNAQRKGARP